MPITITELLARIGVDETPLDKGLASADAKLNKFAGNASSAAEKIARAFAPVEGTVTGLATAMMQAALDSYDLSGSSDVLARALRGLGSGAKAADANVAALTTSTGALSGAMDALEGSSGAAEAALTSLDEGASFAQKALSGLGRVTTGVITRLDGLSGVAFDSARIVGGADAATASLDALKAAARGVPGAVAGVSRTPFLIGGGRAGMAAAEEGRAMTFGGGLRAGSGAAGDLAGGAAMVTTVLAAVSGKMAAEFSDMLQSVKGNTTMSSTDAADMRRLTLALMKNGTPAEEIAKAYGHIQNMNYRGQDAATILVQANKMGVATHTNTEDTGQVLARLLREYNQPASRVRAVAETAHLTSAGGDMYLKEFDKYAGKAYATAANSKVNMPEVSAMLQAMTQHGLDIAKASTQAVGLITQMRNPTPQAFKYAKSIGLGDYLGSAALEKYQPSGILAAVESRTGGDAQKIGNIFKARQGGLGAAVLTGMGAGTYNTALNDPRTGTRAAFAGKTDAIDPLYQQQMQQTAQQFKALSGEIRADFIPIGAKLAPLFAAAIPVVRAFAHGLTELLDAFAKLPKPAQEAILAFGAFKIVSSFLPMLTGFSLVSEKTTVVLGGLARALTGGGAAAEVGAAGIAGMALPLVAVAAAVAAFALAWQSDFGHIREVTAKVSGEVVGFVNSQFGQVKTWFTKNMPLIQEAVKVALTFIQEFWKSHGQEIMGIIGPLWSFIKDTVTNALHIIESVIKLALDIITGHWSAAGKDLIAIVVSLWNEVDSLFENGGKLIDSALMLIIGVVLDFGKRLFEGMLNAGQQAINGIVGGIKAGYGKVAAAASGLGQSITGAVHGALQIHSPSRVMFDAGTMAALGLALGLSAGSPAVAVAADKIGETVHAHVRKHLTDAQKEARSFAGDMGKAKVTGQFLAAGYSPQAARAAGRYHALGPDVQKEIADQKQANDEVQRSNTLWRDFSKAVAGAKAQINALRSAQKDGGDKQDLTIAGQVARQFPKVPQGMRAGLTNLLQQGAAIKKVNADAAKASADQAEGMKQLGEMSQEWAGRLTDSVTPAKTNLEAVNRQIEHLITQYHLAATDPAAKAFFDQIRAGAQGVDLADVNSAVSEMRTKSATSLTDVQARIAGIYDPAKAAGEDWLASNQGLVDKIKALYADPKDALPLIGILQGDAAKKADADQQLAGLDKMRSMMADLRKQMLDMSITDPFERFKASMLEMDANGNLALPKGVTDSDLQQTFKLQQQVAAMQKTQEMIGQLKSGIVDTLSGALQGMFSGQGNGQDWNSLQQQLTEEQQQKTSLSQSLLQAPTAIAGTNNLTVITEAKATTQASLDAVNQQISETKKKLGAFHRDALTMFTSFFKSVTTGFAGMLDKIGMEIIQSNITQKLSKMLGNFGGLFGGGGSIIPFAGNGSIASILGSGGPSAGQALSFGGTVPTTQILGMGLPTRAFGGPAFAGSSYVVGDGGEPEVFTPGQNGTITPMSRAGGGDVHIHLNITTPDANSFRASQGQIMADAYSAGMRAKQRSGR